MSGSSETNAFASDHGRCFIIAEIGNNHEGDAGLAREMIDLAAGTGVDAVKFQTFLPEHYSTVLDTNRQDRLRDFQLSFDDFAALAEHARAKGLKFLSTPFDLESARFLGGVVDAMKIASGDNTFYPLIETAARSKRPLLISTGIASEPEIAAAVSRVETTWESLGVTRELALLHCVVSYPVPPEEANLAAVSSLTAAFPDRIIGYSDHTLGPEAALLAAAQGARIVEKHFTIDNNYSGFRDHQVSADPPAMKRFVETLRRADRILGAGEIGAMPCEKGNIEPVRRSICAARDLPAGTEIALSDITWVRPGGGIPPGGEAAVIGRRLNKALENGAMILNDHLEPQ